MLVHGSRKSANHGIFNLAFIPMAIRCMECGGPVLIIASCGLSARYFERYLIDGRIQNFLASGIKKLPRIQISNPYIQPFFLSETKLAVRVSLCFWPVKNLNIRYGSQIFLLITVTLSGISFERAGSYAWGSGLPGV